MYDRLDSPREIAEEAIKAALGIFREQQGIMLRQTNKACAEGNLPLPFNDYSEEKILEKTWKIMRGYIVEASLYRLDVPVPMARRVYARLSRHNTRKNERLSPNVNISRAAPLPPRKKL